LASPEGANEACREPRSSTVQGGALVCPLGVPATISRDWTGTLMIYSVTPNIAYGVYLFAEAFTTDSFGTERASSTADPKIGFDPNFADAGLFQLEFSQGVLPFDFSASAVPGPTSSASSEALPTRKISSNVSRRARSALSNSPLDNALLPPTLRSK
jgi:hypothetical protein